MMVGFVAIEGVELTAPVGNVHAEAESREGLGVKVLIGLGGVIGVVGDRQFEHGAEVAIVAQHSPLDSGELRSELIFLGVGGTESGDAGVVDLLPFFERFVRQNVVFRRAYSVFGGVLGR
ncbi:MAG: hypothetical protein IAF94_00395 [Pirellulaceae bacterium]|nr:hypothetical protein [Pirellulaceae bacterium]